MRDPTFTRRHAPLSAVTAGDTARLLFDAFCIGAFVAACWAPFL